MTYLIPALGERILHRFSGLSGFGSGLKKSAMLDGLCNEIWCEEGISQQKQMSASPYIVSGIGVPDSRSMWRTHTS